MSYSKIVHLECGANEFTCIGSPDYLEIDTTIDSARRFAAEHGWTYTDGMDICPCCTYIRNTGCECEVTYTDDGKVRHQMYAAAANRCTLHESQTSDSTRRKDVTAKRESYAKLSKLWDRVMCAQAVESNGK